MLRSAQIALWITAALIAFFAVGLFLRPSDLTAVHGLQTLAPSGLRSEIRATQGGFKLGLAIALVVLSRPAWVVPGLAVAVCVLASSLAGRLLGLTADGWSTLHVIVSVAEAIGVISCSLHFFWLSAEQRHAVRGSKR